MKVRAKYIGTNLLLEHNKYYEFEIIENTIEIKSEYLTKIAYKNLQEFFKSWKVITQYNL